MAKYLYEIFLDKNYHLQMNKYKVVYENKYIYVIKTKAHSGIRMISKTNISKDVSQFLEIIHTPNPFGIYEYLDHNPKDNDPEFFKNINNSKTKYISQIHEAFQSIIKSSNNISFHNNNIDIQLGIIKSIKTLYPDLYKEELDKELENILDESRLLNYLEEVDKHAET